MHAGCRMYTHTHAIDGAAHSVTGTCALLLVLCLAFRRTCTQLCGPVAQRGAQAWTMQ